MVSREFAKAEACFLRTRTLAPESLETILNLGYALDMQGRNDEALDCYEAVLAISPQNAKARYNRAAHLLRAGDFASGFADYEARFSAMKSADSRSYSQPRWDGSSLEGRTVLVYCEQGLGDAIQFSRYIPLLAEKGGRVILEAQQPLLSLLASLHGVEQVVLKSEIPPVTDFYVPLLSLPRLFGTTATTIPAAVPYLSPPGDMVAYWQALLGERHNDFCIGLVWAGKPTPDPNRSCPPGFLAPLWGINGTRYYSLQYREPEQLPLSKEMADHVIDLADNLGDFAKTAALIATLDLVITIDTVIAHLAGALGKPVWVMLPFASDWRWMNSRADSPWYPTMKLFRQPEPGDWVSVVRQVAQTLRQQLSQQENDLKLSTEMLETKFQQALNAIENNDSDTAVYELRNLLVHLPDDPAVWFNLARAYGLAGQLSEAEQAYRRALSDSPDSPAILFALGEILLKQKSYPEAELYLHKAHILKPESFEILLGLGNVLSSQGKIIEAIGICKKILTLRPDCLEVVYNLATLQLRSGDYLAGFANFEARLDIEKFDIDPRHYPQPRWDGSPLNGRSILVYGEQGVGDVIQFVRYIPLVAERGGKVVFEVDPPLIPLLESFPGVHRIVPKSKTPPITDVYIQLMSLPYILGTTIDTVPDRVPYIYPDAARVIKWQQILGNRPVFKIGLAWRGNPKNPRDKERSCGLNVLTPLGGFPDVEFFSLQVGETAAEAASGPTGMHLVDTSSLQAGFTETAALIANLDLVISVDTAVAHLAGAMGTPVWLLLTKGTEWRWLDGRCDTPWYPTMRVFEREQEHDWQEVVGQVRDALEKLLAERPEAGQTDIEAGYRLGGTLKEAGDLVGAESCFRQIVEQHPDLPDPQYSLGVVLQLQGRLPEAISHYRAATALDPGFVKAHYNLANALLHSALYRDAIESAKTTIKYDPMHADAHWLLGMLLLQCGDFANGWREYEWRWKASGFTSRTPDLGCRQWDGSPLVGRTLLIHMEQGRGDMIQFIRYASLAAGMGGQVVVCALPELVSLLATVDGISLVVDRNGTLPVFDVHIPVQSLPYVFGTILETVPANVPYLRPDPVKVAEWQRLFPDGRRFRIGLVWQGTPTHRNDHNRSCPLSEFVPLSGLAGVDFYSLQIGTGSEQIHGMPECMTVVDLTGRIQDFSDTAAMIANLDLVISVDTAVAHLAGALGKPVWTMLPYVPEWRWLLGRDDSPWYPGMRLFRQTAPGDWKSVFCKLKNVLELLLCSPEKLNQLGICLLKSGSAVRAELAFSRAIACEPDNAEFHCNRGVALDSLCRYEEAIYCYQEALFYKPDFFNAMFNLGNAYVSINKPEEARACFGRVVEFNQNIAGAYLCLGEVEKRMRNFTLALAAFERAIAIDLGCAEAFQGIAEVCQAEERFEDAIAAYGRALALKPGNVAALNMLGMSYQSIEQLGKAEECYRLALTLTPDKLTVLNNLAVVLNSQGRMEEAVKVYRQLLEIDSGYADGHWNLSVALLALGEYSEGWSEFEWRFKKA
ncbi:MAG: tetratricopeptide repeat protein, partial [Pseudomonadota bacterium]